MLTKIFAFAPHVSSSDLLDVSLILIFMIFMGGLTTFLHHRKLASPKPFDVGEAKRQLKIEMDFSLATELIVKSEYDYISAQLNVKNLGMHDVKLAKSSLDKAMRFNQLIAKYGKAKAVKISSNDFYTGMTKEELTDSMGEAHNIIISNDKASEIWQYKKQHLTDEFVFINGELISFPIE